VDDLKPPLEQVAQLSVQGHQSQANQLFQNEIVRDEAMQQTLETTTNYNISEAKRHTAKTVDEAKAAIQRSTVAGAAVDPGTFHSFAVRSACDEPFEQAGKSDGSHGPRAARYRDPWIWKATS
jgi:hypothetical protein